MDSCGTRSLRLAYIVVHPVHPARRTLKMSPCMIRWKVRGRVGVVRAEDVTPMGVQSMLQMQRLSSRPAI